MTRELAHRLTDGHLVASDHPQNITDFGETDVNLAGKPVAGNQSNQPLKVTRSTQPGVIAARVFKALQSGRPLAALQGESRGIQLPEPEQCGNLRILTAIPPVALHAMQHILQTDQRRLACRYVTFGKQRAVFGEFVLDACRNRKIVGLESPAQLDSESVIRGRVVVRIEKADRFTGLASDHCRRQAHQKSPAHALEDAAPVMKHVLVRRALDDRSPLFADRLARLINAQIVILLAGRQVEQSRADLASYSGITIPNLHAVMFNNATASQVFPKLIGNELLSGKGFKKADAEFQMMRQPLIIGVKKGYIRAGAGVQTGVARPSRSLIFLPNEFQSRVASFDQRHGIVG